jgi:hypothetical protein
MVNRSIERLCIYGIAAADRQFLDRVSAIETGTGRQRSNSTRRSFRQSPPRSRRRAPGWKMQLVARKFPDMEFSFCQRVPIRNAAEAIKFFTSWLLCVITSVFAK